MISKLEIDSFKSINKMELDLKNLNVFVGTNSSGKSSILQALLVLSQSLGNEYVLNGPLIQLGTFGEVRNVGSRNENISISTVCDGKRISLSINEDEEITFSEDFESINEDDNSLYYRNKKLHYLSANRVSGMDLYPRNMDNFDDFGIDGRYSIDYLFNHRSDVIDKELIIDSAAMTLQFQLNYWLKKIMNMEVNVSEIPRTDVVKIEYKNDKENVENLSDKFSRPKNVGSGNSYIISIIILCLASKKDDIIIIENPELHLHPKAQSELSNFLFHIAENGRQLFVETHSDHVYNSMRVKVAKDNSARELISVNFVSLDENYETLNTEVEIGDGGEILNPTADLFDQFENDLLSMLGI